MIEGPLGDMLARNHAKKDFKAPPHLMDVRPMALETPGASFIVLICSDPRLNPGEILDLSGASGNYFLLLPVR
jgi:carbonic anhydrase